MQKSGLLTLKCAMLYEVSPKQAFLANKLLQKRLFPHGYFKCPKTLRLWKHNTRPIAFKSVVDDLGVKYVGKEHADHLIKCIKIKYELTKDWTGYLFCGIKLNWDYSKPSAWVN
jgi:hypothetical protein